MMVPRLRGDDTGGAKMGRGASKAEMARSPLNPSPAAYAETRSHLE